MGGGGGERTPYIPIESFPISDGCSFLLSPMNAANRFHLALSSLLPPECCSHTSYIQCLPALGFRVLGLLPLNKWGLPRNCIATTTDADVEPLLMPHLLSVAKGHRFEAAFLSGVNQPKLCLPWAFSRKWVVVRRRHMDREVSRSRGEILRMCTRLCQGARFRCAHLLFFCGMKH